MKGRKGKTVYGQIFDKAANLGHFLASPLRLKRLIFYPFKSSPSFEDTSWLKGKKVLFKHFPLKNLTFIESFWGSFTH